MNNLGVLSILVCWAGLFFLIWKWKGNSSMTFSQHAARQKPSIIYYAILWLLVLPPFYWFLMFPFAEKTELGLPFRVLVSVCSIAMLMAALIPETNGWKHKIHRISAYLMAYTMCPIVLLIATEANISTTATILTWVIGLTMLFGVTKSIIEKRQHSDITLIYQATYSALFHIAILLAYYL